MCTLWTIHLQGCQKRIHLAATGLYCLIGLAILEPLVKQSYMMSFPHLIEPIVDIWVLSQKLGCDASNISHQFSHHLIASHILVRAVALVCPLRQHPHVNLGQSAQIECSPLVVGRVLYHLHLAVTLVWATESPLFCLLCYLLSPMKTALICESGNDWWG